MPGSEPPGASPRALRARRRASSGACVASGARRRCRAAARSPRRCGRGRGSQARRSPRSASRRAARRAPAARAHPARTRAARCRSPGSSRPPASCAPSRRSAAARAARRRPPCDAHASTSGWRALISTKRASASASACGREDRQLAPVGLRAGRARRRRRGRARSAGSPERPRPRSRSPRARPGARRSPARRR